jgi:tetratricopeptide (TPR) repeat protein
VTVRLTDNASFRQLWSERYDGDWEDLPSAQEKVAKSIVAAIPVQVEQAELERVQHCEIHSLSAYEHCLRGRDYQRSRAHDSHAKAFEHFSRALEQDPGSAVAHCGLALCYFHLGGCTRLDEGGRRLNTAISHAQQAIENDPLGPQGHWTLGMLLQMMRDFHSARLHLDRAVELSPGDAETLAFTGLEFAYAGDPIRGAGKAQRAIQLNPCFPPAFAELIGKSSFIGRRYDEALFWLRQSPDRVTSNRGWLAAAAAYAGRGEEAATHARAMRGKLNQNLGADRLRALGGPIAWLREPARFQNASDLEHYERGLEMAGLR